VPPGYPPLAEAYVGDPPHGPLGLTGWSPHAILNRDSETALIWIHAAFAATPPPLDMGETSFRVEREVMCLPSGLRVLYHQQPSNPTVYWTTLVGVGSTSDPEGHEGLAHLVEHLWFDSTPFRLVTDRVASNASTNPDLTTYWSLGPDDLLEPLVRVESQRFGGALQGVTSPVVEREKGIVEAERRWRYENAALSGYAMLPSLFDPSHPYHRATIGTRQSIASLTLADVQSFWLEHVTPDRTTWVVTGPQSVAEFQELLKTKASHDIWTPSPDADCRPSPAPDAPEPTRPSETRWREFEAAARAPHAVIGWVLPPGYGHDSVQQRRALRMVHRVGSWRCSLKALRLASVATCRMDLDSSPDAESYRAQVQRNLDRIIWTWDSSDRGLQHQVFSWAYTNTIASLLTDLELTASEHTDARQWHYTGDLMGIYRQLLAAAPVKPGSDNRELQDWFDQKKATVTIVTPRADAGTVAEGRSHGPPRSDTGLDETVEPLPEAITEAFVGIDDDEIATRTLDNGLEVWVLPFGDSPFVRSRLVLRGGRENAPDLAVHELVEGLRDNRAVVQNMPIYHAPVVIGGDWYDWSSGAWRTEIGIRSVKGRLEGQLYLLRSRLDGSRLAMDLKAGLLDTLAEDMWTSLSGPEAWARLHRDRSLAGEPDQWTPELLETARKTKKGTLERWFRAVVSPRDAVLVIVGDVDPVRAFGSAQRWLGSWKARGRGEFDPRQRLQPDPAPSLAVFGTRTRSDATIHVACPQRGVTERAVRWMADTLFDELVTSTLRETWGATYGVSTWLERKGEEEGIWHLDVDVPPGIAGPAVGAIRSTLARLASGEIAIQRAKLAYAWRTRYRMRDPADVTRRVLEVVRDGGDPGSLGTELARLQALTPKDLAAIFAACPDHEVITVVGPQEPIQASLRDAGESATVVDWAAAWRDWMMEHDRSRLRQFE